LSETVPGREKIMNNRQKSTYVLCALASAAMLFLAGQGCKTRHPDVVDEVARSARLKYVASTRFAGAFNEGLVVRRGIAYIGSQESREILGAVVRTRNYLYAYELATGRKLWDRTLLSGPGEGFHDCIVQGRTLLCGPSSSGLWAFDARAGEEAWCYSVNPDVTGQFAQVVAQDYDIYACSRGGELVALRLLKGSVKWKRDLGRYSSGPLLAGKGVVIRGGNRLVCYSQLDGSLMWQVLAPPYWARPELKYIDGKICFIAGGAPPELRCIDATDGTEVWSVKVDKGFTLLPENTESVVVFQDGSLRLMNPGDGTDFWRPQKLLRESENGQGAHEFRDVIDYGDVLLVEMRERSRAQIELSVIDRKTGARIQYVVLYQNAPWQIVGDMIVSIFQDNIRAWRLKESKGYWSRDFKEETLVAENTILRDGKLLFLARGGSGQSPPSRLVLYGVDLATGEIVHRFATGFDRDDVVRLIVDGGNVYLWNMSVKLLFRLEGA